MMKKFAGMAAAVAVLISPVVAQASDAVRPVAAIQEEGAGDGVSTGLLIAGGVAAAAVLAFVVFDGDDEPNSP